MKFLMLLLLLLLFGCGATIPDSAPAAAVKVAPAKRADVRILFIGNSHTGVNDLYNMVKYLLESDGSGRTVDVAYRFVEHLNDAKNDRQMLSLIDGDWNTVVLQAAMVSSSLTYSYPQDGGIQLAQEAKKTGKRVVLFVEWPRRGIDESDFTVHEYKKIASASGAEIAAACYATDLALKKRPDLDLWAADGNHSSVAGAYLAACSIYYHLTGSPSRTPSWRPESIPPDLARFFIEIAKVKH
jgi:hypothetical protein